MESSLYLRVGGESFFRDLTARFYEAIATDALLRPMYPDDLDAASERLCLFLIQYFGGPNNYEALRGEPMLRLRHLEFPIDKRARDRWLLHMTTAVEESTDDEEVKSELVDYFANTSAFLINKGLAIGGT